MAPSLSSEIADYKAANLSDQEIKELLYIKRFGLVPNEKYTYNADAAARSAQKSSVLMAQEEVELYLCQTIDNDSNLEDIVDAFNATGGKYSRLQSDLSASIQDSTVLKQRLLDLKSVLCD